MREKLSIKPSVGNPKIHETLHKEISGRVVGIRQNQDYRRFAPHINGPAFRSARSASESSFVTLVIV